MKRFISITAAVLCFFLIITNSNCSQKDEAIEGKSNAGNQQGSAKKALTRVDDPNSISFDQMRLFSPGSQRAVFNKMNSANKARIWLERINYVSSLYKNPVKKEKILELRNFISPELFSNKLHLSNVDNQINIWVANNVPLFGYNNLRLIMTTFMGLKSTDPIAEDFSEVADYANPCPPCDDGDSDPPLCTCSRQSDWCSGSRCGPAGCVIGYGCGTFWAYECNGKCGGTLGGG